MGGCDLVLVKLASRLRIVDLLLRRRMARSMEEARGLVMRGDVFVGGVRVDKAGQLVSSSAPLVLRERSPYVGRGGLKLAAALEGFSLDPSGLVVIDAGSSTGGFTDCLLQRGAAAVHAVDVGRGLLDWKLRTDPRVHLLEGRNIRFLTLEDTGVPSDMAVLDLSFISLRKVLPVLRGLLRPGGLVLALVKPQFEAGRHEVGRGGIVRDRSVRERVLEEVASCARGSGYGVLGTMESPVRGARGNREYWLFLRLS